MNADGSGKTSLARNVASQSFHDWSPDGRRIAYEARAAIAASATSMS